MSTTDQIIADFDELADLVETGESGQDFYDDYLLSLIPSSAQSVLEIGCGLGRLTRAIASENRSVVGIDVSPRMIKRAKLEGSPAGVTFVEGDFIAMDFDEQRFDCVVSAAALHHMPSDSALQRMRALLRPRGRLIIHDLRRDSTVVDLVRSSGALCGHMLRRLARTGHLREPKSVRDAWERHGAHERYLSFAEAEELAGRHFPGASVKYHWLWRYTITWESPK